MRRALYLAPLALLALSCTGESGVVVYNAAPTTALLSPPDGTSFDENAPIAFEGRVTDDGPLPELEIQWTSDKDGLLTDNATPEPDGDITFTTANLTPGNHVITLRAIDAEGEQGVTTVSVTVIDLPDPPEIDLLSPTQGEEYLEGEDPFPFGALVTDAQDAPEDLEVVFLSDHDGFLCAAVPDAAGEARCQAAPLPNERPHLITAEVTDSDGNMNNATAYLTVVAEGEQDKDGDGFTPAQGDCNDNNDSVFPTAEETANGVDDDCDGIVDEGTANYDDDGDGLSEVEGDCDDTNRLTYPGAPEVEDGEDNDCDGTVDEGTRVYDDDGDGYTEVEGDCDDDDPDRNPGETEVCNSIDDDCDAVTDEEDAVGCSTYWADVDKDGYGDADDRKCLCAARAPHDVRNSRDCYDGNKDAKPGQLSWFGTDRGDGSYDYNCDGVSDQRWTDLFDCSGGLWICLSHDDGWDRSTPPSCGARATWATECDGGGWGCSADGTSTRQQTCR